MKRITLFALLASVSMVMFAQATDLVVDNQNPGWLSNVISFGDQKTVKNLKVTGYINDTDLKFIGTLMNNRSLDGTLDLFDVNVVDVDGKDNYLGYNTFGLEKADKINCVRLPQTCTLLNKCFDGSQKLSVDTLYFNCSIRYIDSSFWGTSLNTLIIGNSVDSIGRIQNLKEIKFSQTIKGISDRAFAENTLQYVNIQDLVNLDYLGDFSFVYSERNLTERSLYTKNVCYCPDSLVLPTTWKTFNSSAFQYKEGEHIFLGDAIESITCAVVNAAGSPKYGITYAYIGNIFLHMKTMTPPSLYARLSDNCTVYVPKGASNNYLADENWKRAIIVEENPVEKILLDKHTASMEVGETLRLIPTFIPSDADDKTLAWSVKDESIAKVEDGVVTALAPGKTWVYATSVVEDVKDSCEVTVIQHVTDITFDTPAVTLEGIGATAQLNVIVTPEDATDKSVTWSSSNPSVCVVSNGKIVAVGYGTSVVIATSVDGGHMAVATVKVNEAGEVTLTIQQSANGAVSTQVEKGSVQTFAIQAESGWKIHSVTFNDADVTSDLDATNRYTTPTITENSTLYVTFEEDSATEVKATEASDIRVQSTSFGVRILNAANETANIYTPDGVLVKTVKVASAQMDVELPEGSIYLVQVAAKTVKVSR